MCVFSWIHNPRQVERLPPAEQEQFWTHLLGCPNCYPDFFEPHCGQRTPPAPIEPPLES